MIIDGAMAVAVMKYCEGAVNLRSDPVIADLFDTADTLSGVDYAAQTIYNRLIELRKNGDAEARKALDYFEKLTAVIS